MGSEAARKKLETNLFGHKLLITDNEFCKKKRTEKSQRKKFYELPNFFQFD